MFICLYLCIVGVAYMQMGANWCKCMLCCISISFAQFCIGLGIIHYCITIGNSEANGQVEWMIQMPKGCTQRGLIKEPASFGINYLALAPLLFCRAASQMMDVAPYLLAISS